jgi:hypothetical protein
MTTKRINPYTALLQEVRSLVRKMTYRNRVTLDVRYDEELYTIAKTAWKLGHRVEVEAVEQNDGTKMLRFVGVPVIEHHELPWPLRDYGSERRPL